MRILLITALLFAATASAQQAKLTDADKAQIKAEITATVNTYIREIFAGNAKAVAETFYEPSFSVGAGSITSNTRATQETVFGAAGKRLQGEGWVSASFRPINVCIMTPNSALAGMNLYRKKADGSEHLINSETMLLARAKDGWKIVSLFVHEGADKYATCPP